MLEIDCSYGEGGGQIIRSAISLSAVTGTDIRLTKIRNNRPNPGLASQHITAVKVVGRICNAKYSDLRIGLDKMEFLPGKITPGEFSFDIGTAGSITLVLQAFLLPALFCRIQEKMKIRIFGGTDVKWSPPYDYLRSVFLEHLKSIGAQVDVKLINRGYYPKGGGEVFLQVTPSNEYASVNLADRGKFIKIAGTVNNRKLPSNIPERIQNSAINLLKGFSPVESSIDDNKTGRSPGCGIVLYSIHEQSILGASELGEKGIPAERVGEYAAMNLLDEINASGAVDIHASDQLIPYLALLSGTITVRKLSEHTRTNIWLVEQFLNKRFQVENLKDFIKITCH